MINTYFILSWRWIKDKKECDKMKKSFFDEVLCSHLVSWCIMDGYLDFRKLLIFCLPVNIVWILNSYVSQKGFELFLHIVNKHVLQFTTSEDFVNMIFSFGTNELIGLAKLLKGLPFNFFLFSHLFCIFRKEREVAYFILLFFWIILAFWGRNKRRFFWSFVLHLAQFV